MKKERGKKGVGFLAQQNQAIPQSSKAVKIFILTAFVHSQRATTAGPPGRAGWA
jgi:hypothetical protein